MSSYREVGRDEEPMVSFGGGWLLSPDFPPAAPNSDRLEHERLAALIEAENDAYAEAHRRAEEAAHFAELDASGQGRTMAEIFAEQMAMEPREQARRDSEERLRERNQAEGLVGDAAAGDLSDLLYKSRLAKSAMSKAGREKDPSDPAHRRTRTSDESIMAWAKEGRDKRRREREAADPNRPRIFGKEKP
ncbi:MAG: hypothetical protein ABJA93_12465 [Sporichthyaceae bacterium]